MGYKNGPTISIVQKCHGCNFLKHSLEVCGEDESDEGIVLRCLAPITVKVENIVYHDTPNWCPFLVEAIREEADKKIADTNDGVEKIASTPLQEKTMRVIIAHADGKVEVRDIENGLTSLQGIVGGFVQQIGLNNLIVLMNEDGKNLNLPINKKASNVVHYGGAFGLDPDDVLVGTVVFCSMEGENWASIKSEDEIKVQKLLSADTN